MKIAERRLRLYIKSLIQETQSTDTEISDMEAFLLDNGYADIVQNNIQQERKLYRRKSLRESAHESETMTALNLRINELERTQNRQDLDEVEKEDCKAQLEQAIMSRSIRQKLKLISEVVTFAGLAWAATPFLIAIIYLLKIGVISTVALAAWKSLGNIGLLTSLVGGIVATTAGVSMSNNA